MTYTSEASFDLPYLILKRAEKFLFISLSLSCIWSTLSKIFLAHLQCKFDSVCWNLLIHIAPFARVGDKSLSEKFSQMVVNKKYILMWLSATIGIAGTILRIRYSDIVKNAEEKKRKKISKEKKKTYFKVPFWVVIATRT